ncbi:hypothetical protein VMCG_05134 [Cytospora schulzeri]|uniref:non-specific serine/threonine protein kinase n=1 Tax=Cytospora schulzeri TaxID=448051 RepID=A0A423WQX3_9PEZI|nr:hypothetical protein VMCG_05134 [Valsa malicola]
MIGQNWRYWAPSGAITPGGPSIWHIGDWDQRRTIAVITDGEQEDDSLTIEHLKRHIDDAGPGVYAIKVSDKGELLSVSTDFNDDATMCPHYPLLQELHPLDRSKTVMRSRLQELDRLGPNVDLVFYETHGLPDQGGQPKHCKVVFKYYFYFQFLRSRWDEMNIWMRLPPRPNVVPFDRLVIEELYGRQRVVGFTSLHVAGGTLDRIYENPSDTRIFKLKWLTQLCSLIDELNFTCGMQHQDVAPRNLLVDETPDNIMLFDFNYSARIGGPLRGGYHIYWEDRNDVKGVVFTLYEIITRDDHFRTVPHWEQNASSVLDMKHWVQHPDVKLDHLLAEYRAVLDGWLQTRKERGNVTVFTDAPQCINWPDLQEPSCYPDEDPSQQAADEEGQDSVAIHDQSNTLGEGPEAPELDYSVERDVWDGDDPDNQEFEYAMDDIADPIPTSAPPEIPRWTVPGRDEWNENRRVIEWERPAQAKIKEGTHVCADGRVVKLSN